MSMRLLITGIAVLLSMQGLAAAEEALWKEPSTGIEFVRIAKGCFQMGVPENAFAIDDDEIFLDRIKRTEMPAHEVCLDEFWIGRTEVTEGQWRAVMGEPAVPVGDQHPVTAVRWQDATEFAKKLNERMTPALRVRLPTEAEWEFACRAGAAPQTRILGTDVVAPFAWFSYAYDLKGIDRYKTVHPVATRKPNASGLQDMLGNAWEWTQDHFEASAYRTHSRHNPLVTSASPEKVIRGGGFQTAQQFTRCEARGWMDGDEIRSSVGFRLVLIRQGEK